MWERRFGGGQKSVCPMSNPELSPQNQSRQPIFLLPGVVSAVIGLMLAIQAAQSFVLDEEGQFQLAVWFGFIPLRLFLPEDWLPLLWTPISHAFLHAGWEHVLLNSAWLAIFGVPVARRYGPGRFLLVFGASAIAGAAAFAAFHAQDVQVLVGASGAVSGLTGVAMRFVFQPLVLARNEETGEIVAVGRKFASFRDLFAKGTARAFILVWVVLNALVPMLPAFVSGLDVQIAWQAHLGGFALGLLIAPLLEQSMRTARHTN